MKNISESIFKIKNDKDFEKYALLIFNYQYKNNPVYKYYLDLIETDVSSVKSVSDIPCMPIEFFKYHDIKSGKFDADVIFKSSGTENSIHSYHHVKDTKLYKKSILNSFQKFYGNAEDYAVFALLPSYLERGDASLVYMINYLKGQNKQKLGGFYLNEYNKLIKDIQLARNNSFKIILFAVSFALLDMAERANIDLKDVIVIETGGMKGKRKELIREELHSVIKSKLNAVRVDSEYGMTELLSQAYKKGNNNFKTANTLKILIRDIHDPFEYIGDNKQGLINIIDLANIHSCSFLQTNDLGKKSSAGFEILGRLDNSDIRGCNLMI